MGLETDSLLPSNANGDESSKYYFLNSVNNEYQGGTTQAVRDGDGGEIVEGIPEGATEDEFAPRTLPKILKHPSMMRTVQPPRAPSNDGEGFWKNLFGPKKTQRPYGEVGTMLKVRKAPIKIEPKVFFANERTFLAWMHLSVVLAGSSIAILAFTDDNNPMGQLYGVMTLPVAISFISYAMYQYSRRAYMIRTRHPGPYEDTVGPAVLAVMLMLSIVAQFTLKLYSSM